jgi:galactokinase
MPEPVKGESLGDFMGKYMKSKESRKRFPSAKQRAAVAYSEAKRAKLKK